MSMLFYNFLRQLITMSKLIQVPFTSPAFESYVNDGWRQVSVSGLWATLRYEPDRRKASAGGAPLPSRVVSHPPARGDPQVEQGLSDL
jgi:hypothetical protein